MENTYIVRMANGDQWAIVDERELTEVGRAIVNGETLKTALGEPIQLNPRLVVSVAFRRMPGESDDERDHRETLPGSDALEDISYKFD